MQANSPASAGDEFASPAVPCLKIAEPPPVESPTADQPVPRDAARPPHDLAAKFARNGGADAVEQIRQSLLMLLAQSDCRAMDGCLVVEAATAAALFGLSERGWRRHDVQGDIPAPIKIGRSVRWRLAELVDWVDRGCPDRASWNAMRRRPPC